MLALGSWKATEACHHIQHRNAKIDLELFCFTDVKRRKCVFSRIVQNAPILEYFSFQMSYFKLETGSSAFTGTLWIMQRCFDHLPKADEGCGRSCLLDRKQQDR